VAQHEFKSCLWADFGHIGVVRIAVRNFIERCNRRLHVASVLCLRVPIGVQHVLD